VHGRERGTCKTKDEEKREEEPKWKQVRTDYKSKGVAHKRKEKRRGKQIVRKTCGT